MESQRLSERGADKNARLARACRLPLAFLAVVICLAFAVLYGISKSDVEAALAKTYPGDVVSVQLDIAGSNPTHGFIFIWHVNYRSGGYGPNAVWRLRPSREVILDAW